MYHLFQCFMTFHPLHIHKLFAFYLAKITLCILFHNFHLLHFYPYIYIYIYLSITLHAILYQIHINQKRCHLSSIFRLHLPSSNIVVSSNLNSYELATTKEEGLAFYINNNDDYDFDVKVGCCGFRK